MNINLTKDGVVLGARFKKCSTPANWVGLIAGMVEDYETMQWIIGDCYVFGTSQEWGSKCRRAIDLSDKLSHSASTIRKFGWVCSKIEFVRRRTISFSHHELVAGIDVEGIQDMWLRLAQEKSWSVADLRQAICDGNQDEGGKGATEKPRRTILGWATEGLRLIKPLSIRDLDENQRSFLKRELEPIVEFWKQL